jgi:predicted DNA-binding transcriptional regulator YafY
MNLDILCQGLCVKVQFMRSSRLLGILMTLQLRGRTSAAALAREFEVSERTIYRDIDALSASGVPIYAETGRSGGIQLHDGYRTRLTGLTASEASALPFVGMTQVAADMGLRAEAAAARTKMLASLPAESGSQARRIAERFHVDPIPWYHRAETLDHLPELAAAVWKGKRISVAYTSWKADVRRTLDPLGLVQKGGLWYLLATWRGKPHIYRASNLSDLRVRDEAARSIEGFDLAANWRSAVVAFEDRLMAGRAVVRISKEGEQILRAEMPLAAEIVARTKQPCAEPGWSIAEAPFESPAYSARQWLRLGCELQVLEPASLREALIEEATNLLLVYTTSPSQG